jgi:hypothetical protein
MKQSHLFWGSLSPLVSLSGGGILIMATSRLAFGVIAAGALFWVYGLSALAVRAGSRIFPERGKNLILLALTSLIGSVYLLLLWFLWPITALEVFFVVSLVPLFCVGSGVFSRVESLDVSDTAARSLSEAAVLGSLVIVFSIIREPLGFGSLSLPGGFRGLIVIVSFDAGSFLPVRLVTSSAGALVLLGYGVGLYRYFRKIYASREDEK